MLRHKDLHVILFGVEGEKQNGTKQAAVVTVREPNPCKDSDCRLALFYRASQKKEANC